MQMRPRGCAIGSSASPGPTIAVAHGGISRIVRGLVLGMPVRRFRAAKPAMEILPVSRTAAIDWFDAKSVETLRSFPTTKGLQFHVTQLVRPSVPHHHLWRKPRGGAGLRGGWLPGRHKDHSEADIQSFLDKRKPGQIRFTTQRREPDQVKILSGVFEDDRTGGQVTTGTPIALMIENVDQRSKDYSEIRDKFRPGHADFTYVGKIRRPRLSRWRPVFGTRDGRARGGRRRSAQGHPPGLRCVPRWCRWGRTRSTAPTGTGIEVKNNPFFCPDAEAAKNWETYLDGIRKAGSSCGAVIEVIASGVPAGWGAPVYGKLDQDLASAMMSINAVKGVEIGNGFEAAAITGEENADEIRMKDGKPEFLSNNAGGVLGGISTGQDVVCRFAVKPTSSILTPRKTVDANGNETDIVTKGRHDPCVGIRAVPVGEAMMAIVLADHFLRHRGQNG